MYDAGSLFKISFDGESPDEEHLSAIEQSGLGLRRAEGFGQVLFLSESLFGSIKQNSRWSTPLHRADRIWLNCVVSV